jgi:hypothetical protein
MTTMLMEGSPNLLRYRRKVQPTKVPSSDSFYVEEETIVASPEGCTTGSILRVSCIVVFVKRTMLKGTIISGEKKNSTALWLKFGDWIIKNGHQF